MTYKQYKNALFRLVKADVSQVRNLELLMTIPWDYQMFDDFNRAQDVETLRHDLELDRKYSNIPYNCLEVIIMITQRILDMVGDIELPPIEDNGRGVSQFSFIFWKLISNLKLKDLDKYYITESDVEKAMDRWINRTYDSKGNGNLLKLRKYAGDQRNLTIWEQINKYANENFL